MNLQDGRLERLCWRAFGRAGRVVGPLRARALAALVLGMQSRTERGYVKTMYRVARHTSSPMPGIIRLPESWSALSPLVRARRLGLVFELDLRDNLQRTLYYAGSYEPTLVRFIARELRRGDVFVDVGAHIGVHALAAARRLRELGDGRVFAFEPTGDSAAKLRKAAARNRLDLTVVERALGDSSGTVELRTDPDYGLDDAGVRSQYGAGSRVQTSRVTTFDVWADEAGLTQLDLVKIDVEGAEPLVVRGMRDLLRRLRPRALVVEMKPATLERAGADVATVRHMLESSGYAPAGRPLLFHNQVYRPTGP